MYFVIIFLLSLFIKFFIVFAYFRYFSVEFHFIGPVALIVFQEKMFKNEESRCSQDGVFGIFAR